MNKDTVMFVCGYAGDADQIQMLRPVLEHHQIPIVILSPSDSPIRRVGPHICRFGGGVGYVGQVSLDRQYEHFKIMLEYPWKWVLWNDSDSCVLDAKLPDYLYEDEDTVWGNVVDDFRKPGESWQGLPPWPLDYHAGFDLKAIQPPYFMSRKCVERIVATCSGIKACKITPFIDFYVLQCVKQAGLKYRGFPFGASCETKTDMGKAVMRQCIAERGAMMVHAIKSAEARDLCISARKEYLSRQ